MPTSRKRVVSLLFFITVISLGLYYFNATSAETQLRQEIIKKKKEISRTVSTKKEPFVQNNKETIKQQVKAASKEKSSNEHTDINPEEKYSVKVLGNPEEKYGVKVLGKVSVRARGPREGDFYIYIYK